MRRVTMWIGPIHPIRARPPSSPSSYVIISALRSQDVSKDGLSLSPAVCLPTIRRALVGSVSLTHWACLQAICVVGGLGMKGSEPMYAASIEPSHSHRRDRIQARGFRSGPNRLHSPASHIPFPCLPDCSERGFRAVPAADSGLRHPLLFAVAVASHLCS